MPLLATFTNVSTLSLAGNSFGCIAHGIITQPDWAVYQSTHTFGGAVGLFTRHATALIVFNSGGSAIPGEVTAQFVHSIVR